MITWREKWRSIESKLDTCICECRAGYRSDQKCKDSLEAVIADLWHFKDWLQRDPAAPVTSADIRAFLNTPEAFHIRAVGDLATLDKHATATSKHRVDTKLIREHGSIASSGLALIFSTTRDYGDGNLDQWEDAVELAIRARNQWQAYLAKLSLI